MSKKSKANKKERKEEEKKRGLHPDTKTSILAIIFLGSASIFFLSGLGWAGPIGEYIYLGLETLLGWGYYLIPAALALMGINALNKNDQFLATPTIVGAIFFVLSGLGILDIISEGTGGLAGTVLGGLESFFGKGASLIINLTILAASILATLNIPLNIKFKPREKSKEDEKEPRVIMPQGIDDHPTEETPSEHKEETKPATKADGFGLFSDGGLKAALKDYKFPPLKLLKTSSDKPMVGDLRANANIIKRTLESFGIPVEMGEITIGPKVTRYTLKPAEGVKLSRIEALNQDLSLALAAHPIRIEAPIPGKSLVGIEVPNKVASIVRLGSLMAFPEFTGSGPLGFILGRDVSGDPIIADIEKMPHLLIAGSTGSGKSVAIHSLIISLLYKNSPETLRMILIDPKRVELTIYNDIPHLIAPVITDGKKALGVFRWAIEEMEKRYDKLQAAGARDIKGYNKSQTEDLLPYLLIVVDELADLMAAYGRDFESSIVRLAQMARATGIHLILSTQRP